MKEKRDVLVNFRVSARWKEMLEELAEYNNKTVTAYLIDMLHIHENWENLRKAKIKKEVTKITLQKLKLSDNLSSIIDDFDVLKEIMSEELYDKAQRIYKEEYHKLLTEIVRKEAE